jgi:hypothetical protein
MATAKMAGAFIASHKSHTHPTFFFADIAIFFSFGFWHIFSPLTVFRQYIIRASRGFDVPLLAHEEDVPFQIENLDLLRGKWHYRRRLASIMIMTCDAGADREQEGKLTT